METDAGHPNGESPMPAVSASTATSQKSGSLAESLKLEHQFVRVPFEKYKNIFRANHRMAEKEASAIISGVSKVADSQLSRDEAVQKLNSLVSRLQGFKRKLEEGSRLEQSQASKCRARLEHLESAGVDDFFIWNTKCMNRILVDYMLRMSYYNSASKLADSSGIQELVDIEVFHEAKIVIDALQKKELAPALLWCAENKPKLRKSKSKLEFHLRLQEFIELVRVEDYMRAILYARKHLAPWAATHTKEFQHVFAIVAFRSNCECATYKGLFDGKKWDFLADQFKQEFCRLYGMTVEPLLNIFLQAGLSALKTPFCYQGECTKEDPLSQEVFRQLAEPLPYAKQHHSKLICYISKKVMDTENLPLVLPNGYVYGTKALEEMARQNNGKITCPRTGFTCNYTDLLKAFIS